MIGKKVMTSLTHPLYVNYISSEILKKNGVLGMTFAPGKIDNSSIMSGSWDRNIEEDVKKLKELNTHILVSLIEEFEYELLKIEKLKEFLTKFEIKQIKFQIIDGSVPPLDSDKKENINDFYKLAEDLNNELENGKNIVVHCRGGLGRTGTLVAAILILNGIGADEAIKITREARKGTIENKNQEDFLKINFSKLYQEKKNK